MCRTFVLKKSKPLEEIKRLTDKEEQRRQSLQTKKKVSFCFENIALKSFKKLNELQHLGYTSQHVAVVFGLSVSSAVVGVSKDVGLCKSRAFGCGTF